MANETATIYERVQVEAWQISADMRESYDSFKSGVIKREHADARANMAGKNLKALAIIVASEALAHDQLTISAKAEALDVLQMKRPEGRKLKKSTP